MNHLSCPIWQWQTPLQLQGDRQRLSMLLVQLEEAEERIESWKQVRADLLQQLADLQQQIQPADAEHQSDRSNIEMDWVA